MIGPVKTRIRNSPSTLRLRDQPAEADRGAVAAAAAGRLDRRSPSCVSLSGNVASHGREPEQADARAGMTNAMPPAEALPRGSTTIGGAITEPNCAPALKNPPAATARRGRKETGERLDAGGVVAALASPIRKRRRMNPRARRRAPAGQGIGRRSALAIASIAVPGPATACSRSEQRPPTKITSRPMLRADPVHQLPGRNLTEHHPEVERHGDVAVLRVAPLELRAQLGGEHREHLAVEQVDRDRRRRAARRSSSGSSMRPGDDVRLSSAHQLAAAHGLA